jgi:hypothetical protein
VEKKALLAIAFISVFLLSAVVGTQVINLARANPYSQAVYKGEIAAPSQPTIVITSPQNNTNYNVNSLSIILNVSISKAQAPNYYQWIYRVYYESDWIQEDVEIYKYYNIDPNNIQPPITEFYYRLNLTEIPEGEHHVTFHAIEGGEYYASLFAYYRFSANTSSVLIFTVDTTPPVISVSTMENRTHEVSDVALSFTVNEPVSLIFYSLDGQDNVTIAGNTTLTNVPYGDHNVTVYAIDNAGNTGASETIPFTIAEPPESFPVVPVTTASIASVGIISVGLLVYFKKRKH